MMQLSWLRAKIATMTAVLSGCALGMALMTAGPNLELPATTIALIVIAVTAFATACFMQTDIIKQLTDDADVRNRWSLGRLDLLHSEISRKLNFPAQNGNQVRPHEGSVGDYLARTKSVNNGQPTWD